MQDAQERTSGNAGEEAGKHLPGQDATIHGNRGLSKRLSYWQNVAKQEAKLPITLENVQKLLPKADITLVQGEVGKVGGHLKIEQPNGDFYRVVFTERAFPNNYLTSPSYLHDLVTDYGGRRFRAKDGSSFILPKDFKEALKLLSGEKGKKYRDAITTSGIVPMGSYNRRTRTIKVHR